MSTQLDLADIQGRLQAGKLQAGQGLPEGGGRLVLVRRGRARVLTPGLDGQLVPSAELGPGDVDLDAVHRAFGECVSHLPANRARALGHGARRAHADGDGGARGERRTYRTKRRGHLHLL